MKKLFALLFAFVAISATAQQKLIEFKTTSGDSLVVNENRIVWMNVKNDTGTFVQYIDYADQLKTFTSTQTMLTIRALATSKQLILCNDSANLINRAFIISAKNLTNTTSQATYFYPNTKLRYINLDFSIDSLKSLANP